MQQERQLYSFCRHKQRKMQLPFVAMAPGVTAGCEFDRLFSLWARDLTG